MIKKDHLFNYELLRSSRVNIPISETDHISEWLNYALIFPCINFSDYLHRTKVDVIQRSTCILLCSL